MKVIEDGIGPINKDTEANTSLNIEQVNTAGAKGPHDTTEKDDAILNNKSWFKDITKREFIYCQHVFI